MATVHDFKHPKHSRIPLAVMRSGVRSPSAPPRRLGAYSHVSPFSFPPRDTDGGTTPSKRGDVPERLKKSGPVGNPAGRVWPASAKSPPEEAGDAPAEPRPPHPPVPCQRPGGPAAR